MSFRCIAEFVFAGRPTRGPSLVPDVGSVTGAVCTAPATLLASNKKEGWEGGTTGGPTGVLREFQAFAPPEREVLGIFFFLSQHFNGFVHT